LTERGEQGYPPSTPERDTQVVHHAPPTMPGYVHPARVHASPVHADDDMSVLVVDDVQC